MIESMHTVIATGASRGIGRATAVRLARDLRMVVAVARSSEAINSTAATIREIGGEALPIIQDMRKKGAADRVVGTVMAATGRIDAVVNVAGTVPQTDLFEMTDEEWADGLSLEFHGARKLAVAAWPALKASRSSVISLSGTTAVGLKASLAAVSSINAAIVALAKAFSEHGVSDGVQVKGADGPEAQDVAPLCREQGIGARCSDPSFPAGNGISRYGDPANIAELIAFLVSPQSRWLTTVAVRMDGGETKSV